MNQSPTTPPPSASDAVQAALGHSAELLDGDPSAVPTPAFRQRARFELLQAMAAPRPATPMDRLRGLTAIGSGISSRRRLAGVGLGAALFGLVAVPAIAAPSSAVGRVTGAIGTAIGDVPALITGAPPAHHPRVADTDDTSSSTSRTSSSSSSSNSATTSSTTSTSTTAGTHPLNHGAIVSAVAHSTFTLGEAHGDAVSAAAHGTATASTTSTATGSATSTATFDADSHGDAVSSVAHMAPPPGENHGQQVSRVARGLVTSTTSGSSVSTTSVTTTGTGDHGSLVSAVAHMPAPAGENHGQQVSRVARGIATSATSSRTSTTSSASTTTSATQGHEGRGNGDGASANSDQGGSSKSHGR